MFRTCFNIKDKAVLPFLSGSWHNIGKQFKKKFVLEKQCDLRRINEYLKQKDDSVQNTQNFNSQFQRKEFIVMGRSNVGKSSLLNKMVDQDLAYTSKSPGKTRTLNFYQLKSQSIKTENIVMVDAPGYGYAKGDAQELQKWGKMINEYLDNSRYLHRIMLLVDSQYGIKQLDFMLMDLLEFKKKPFFIVFTKIDKQAENQKAQLYESMQKQAKEINEKYMFSSPIFHLTSAQSSYGVDDLNANIAYILNMELIRKNLDEIK